MENSIYQSSASVWPLNRDQHPSLESYPGTVIRNVLAMALHLSMGVNTAKLIYSLLHSMDTILKCHLNGCVQGSEYVHLLFTLDDTCKPVGS